MFEFLISRYIKYSERYNVLYKKKVKINPNLYNFLKMTIFLFLVAIFLIKSIIVQI